MKKSKYYIPNDVEAQYYNWIVIDGTVGVLPDRKDKNFYWKVKCKRCGKICLVKGESIVKGRSKQCRNCRNRKYENSEDRIIVSKKRAKARYLAKRGLAIVKNSVKKLEDLGYKVVLEKQ